MTNLSNVPDFQHVAFNDTLPCFSPAVWTAATWATTVMRPTLVASPVSPTAHRHSLGAMASLALAFKRAMLRPPLGDTRAARPPRSTQPTQCHLEATSAARHASSLLKAWMPMTSSPATWVTVTFLGSVCRMMTTTTSQMGRNALELLPICLLNGWWRVCRCLHARSLWKGPD